MERYAPVSFGQVRNLKKYIEAFSFNDTDSREKRIGSGLDFGISRGFSGSKAARQLYGLEKVTNAGGPGK